MTIGPRRFIIRFVERIEAYLQPTELCDFDACAAIREKAAELTHGCTSEQQRFQRIFGFVKELRYGLEDWDVKASETLGKGWGMCCGKTNLLVALSRTLCIPAGYRIFKIKAERALLDRVMEGDERLASHLGNLPPMQDHVQCEVYLGGWQVHDPSRDSALEKGLKALGIPLERVPVVGSDGAVHYEILASIDEWARTRQRDRNVRNGRDQVFARANMALDRIRRLGRQS